MDSFSSDSDRELNLLIQEFSAQFFNSDQLLDQLNPEKASFPKTNSTNSSSYYTGLNTADHTKSNLSPLVIEENKIKAFLAKFPSLELKQIDSVWFNKNIKDMLSLICLSKKGSKMLLALIKHVKDNDKIIFSLMIEEIYKNLAFIMTKNNNSKNFFLAIYSLLPEENKLLFLKSSLSEAEKIIDVNNCGFMSIKHMLIKVSSDEEQEVALTMLKLKFDSLIKMEKFYSVMDILMKRIDERKKNDILSNLLKYTESILDIKCGFEFLLTYALGSEEYLTVALSNKRIIKKKYGSAFILSLLKENKEAYGIKNLIFFKGNVLEMSLGKYSSRIVMKLIDVSDYFMSLFTSEVVNANKLINVITSDFGFPLIQKFVQKEKSYIPFVINTVRYCFYQIKESQVKLYTDFISPYSFNNFNYPFPVQETNNSYLYNSNWMYPQGYIMYSPILINPNHSNIINPQKQRSRK